MWDYEADGAATTMKVVVSALGGVTVWIPIVCVLCGLGWFGGAGVQGKSSPRRVLKIPGDIMIGALFPVHHQPDLKSAYTRQCGRIWEQYGIHRIETVLITLDEINNNPNILPNVSVGIDIRDSCWFAPVALEQSIDFIKNIIASMDRVKEERENQIIIDRGGNKSDLSQCDRASNEKPIAGLIGPGSSTVTLNVQSLLQLFTIPEIGYSATSMSLSDKSLYRSFLRVVPSDVLQAQCLIDVVRRFNWTYISTVFTEGKSRLSHYPSSLLQLHFVEMFIHVYKCGQCEGIRLFNNTLKSHFIDLMNIYVNPFRC